MENTLIDVDLAGIRSLDHRCRGCSDRARCCCATYEIRVTENELRTLLGLLPQAARLAPAVRSPAGYADIFEEEDDGAFSLETSEDGLCVFAFRKGGKIRCALHAAGESLGLDGYGVKPRECVLWPLALSEDEPPILSVHPDAYDFPCNARRKETPRTLAHDVADIIGHVFGQAFLEEVTAATRKGQRRTRITVNRKSA